MLPARQGFDTADLERLCIELQLVKRHESVVVQPAQDVVGCLFDGAVSILQLCREENGAAALLRLGRG